MKSVLRLLVLVLTAGSFSLLIESPAAACPPGFVQVGADNSAFNTALHCERPTDTGTSGSTAPVSMAPQPSYEYQAICDRGPGGADGGVLCGQVGRIPCGDGGFWFHVTVRYPDGRVQRYDACLTPAEAPTASVLTLGVIEQAFRRTPVPRSVMSIQPPGGATLVNLPAIYSTSAEAFVRSFVLVGQQVELRIVPSSYSWVPGDGSVAVVTDEPGTPYAVGRDESIYIRHTYLAAERVRVRVDVTWTATFRVGGAGPWRAVPGSVTRPGVPAPLDVREARASLTG